MPQILNPIDAMKENRVGMENEKQISIHDLKEAAYELFARGEISFIEYLGSDLYRLNENCMGDKKAIEAYLKLISHDKDLSKT